MIDGLSSPVAECLTLTLLHFTWQGLLIGCVFWIWSAASGGHSAQKHYLVGIALLMAMAVCPPLTFAVLHNAAADDASQMPLTYRVPLSGDVPQETPAQGLLETEMTHSGSSRNLAVDLNRHVGLSQAPNVLGAAFINLQPYVLLLWLAGVILSGARLAGGFLNVVWLRSGRMAVPRELAHRASLLARKLQMTSGRVFVSERVRQAAVVGFWRPVVLVPASWLMELPADVLEAVIAHELAHIRRFDLWVNLLQRLIETLLFFHPMVWWLSNRVRLERELCCDQLAAQTIGNRGSYVRALEHVGRLQLRGSMHLAAAFSGAGKMNLLRRVQYVLGVARKPEREPSWLVGALAIATSLAIAFSLAGFPKSSVAVAQDREGGRSAEAEGGPQRSAEADAAPRASAESEAGPRRSAEVEAAPRQSAEGAQGAAGSVEGGGSKSLQGFKPQNQREAVLLQMIIQLQNEVAALRREVQGRGAASPAAPASANGENRRAPSGGAADGDTFALPANWQNTTEGRVFKAYDKNDDQVLALEEWLAMTNGNINAARRELQTKRFNEAEPSGDGKFTPAEFIYWYSIGRHEAIQKRAGTRDGAVAPRGARDGEGAPRGPRDGEGARVAPRDGEGGKVGPRDGEGGKVGPRDGEGRKAGPRDGEGQKAGPRDGEGAKIGPRDGG